MVRVFALACRSWLKKYLSNMNCSSQITGSIGESTVKQRRLTGQNNLGARYATKGVNSPRLTSHAQQGTQQQSSLSPANDYMANKLLNHFTRAALESRPNACHPEYLVFTVC